jgi:membrane-associated phospholipid phosphatase
MIENIKIIFDFVGGYSPLILFLVSIKLLWNTHNLLTYYIYGFFLDMIFNTIIKGIFKQPRPLEDPEIFKLALKNNKRFMFKDGIPYDIFGMPSGHTQSVIYSTVFIYLSLKNNKILIGYILLSLITMYQRVFFKHHTVGQVCVAVLPGTLFAIFMYYMATQKIMGKIRGKKDDNAPV